MKPLVFRNIQIKFKRTDQSSSEEGLQKLFEENLTLFKTKKKKDGTIIIPSSSLPATSDGYARIQQEMSAKYTSGKDITLEFGLRKQAADEMNFIASHYKENKQLLNAAQDEALHNCAYFAGRMNYDMIFEEKKKKRNRILQYFFGK